MRHVSFVLTASVLLGLIVPFCAIAEEGAEPYERTFVITAYYSPLPGQCCYIKGGLLAERIFNGEGHTAADGTAVYPGMAAAPASVPFGTRITLPGLGTVEVHDRGGAIRDLTGGEVRLDLWAGEGEEGLARAIAFGVQRVTGTVYPPSSQERPSVRMDFSKLPTPWSTLQPYIVTDAGLLDVRPKMGDQGLSVLLLQNALRDAGYFTHEVTGEFGAVTRRSLEEFELSVGLAEPADQLTEKTAAFLLAAVDLKDAEAQIAFVGPESAASALMPAQRLLRYLGYYRGRTNGMYDHELFRAILNFQRNHKLVGGAKDPGAGRIGPLTKERLAREWMRLRITERSERYLLLRKIKDHLRERGEDLDRFLSLGDQGTTVELLQRLLAEAGYFPEEKKNGVFGPLTEDGVIRYQIDRSIIANANDPAAGYVGPATLLRFRRERVDVIFRRVRGYGWGAI